MASNLDRFKVMLEEHDGTGITQREYALRDFLALFNTLPGYIGQAALESTTEPEEEKTSVGTLPKGSKVRAFAIKVNEWPQGGTAIQLGTEDDPAHFGEIPIPGPDEQQDGPNVLEDWHNDDEPLPEDTEVFLTLVGFDQQQEENMAGEEEEQPEKSTGLKKAGLKTAGAKAAGTEPTPLTGGCITLVINYERLNSFEEVPA